MVEIKPVLIHAGHKHLGFSIGDQLWEVESVWGPGGDTYAVTLRRVSQKITNLKPLKRLDIPIGPSGVCVSYDPKWTGLRFSIESIIDIVRPHAWRFISIVDTYHKRRTVELAKEGAMTPKEIDVFYDGLVEGFKRWAWWKDGTQWVGSCGTTLLTAIEEAKKERTEALQTGQVRRIPV
jgi:hypothetical protein